MDAFESFLVGNIGLVVIGVIIALIVGDELLGFTRAIFGDEDVGAGRPDHRGPAGDAADGEDGAAPDGDDMFGEDAGTKGASGDETPTVHDLLGPGKKR